MCYQFKSDKQMQVTLCIASNSGAKASLCSSMTKITKNIFSEDVKERYLTDKISGVQSANIK